MECESDNEKKVEKKEDNKVNITPNTPEIKKLEEDLINKKEEIGDKNNAIINQAKKEENINENPEIKKVKKKHFITIKKYNKGNKGKTKSNKDINTNTIYYDGDLFIPETPEIPDDFDERFNQTACHFSSNVRFPSSNNGGSEALFSNSAFNYPGNIPFYNEMDNYYDRETHFKSISK